METIVLIFIFLAVLFSAYADGVNDNFAGVVTLYGSSTTNYKSALACATLTTAFGSMVALCLARELGREKSTLRSEGTLSPEAKPK